MNTLFFKESFFLFTVITIIALLIVLLFSKKWAIIFIVYLVIIAFLVYFYRVPNRSVVYNPDVLLAASDGTVKQIIYDKDTKTYRIVVFLHIFNQHLQFYPINGSIKALNYHVGEFHPAYLLEKSKYNERMETILNTKYGDIKITQIAGQIARRIVNKSEVGKKIKQGDYMGMIKLSSRVDIEFSANYFKPSVNIGDKIHAQQTILATLI